MKEHKDNKTSYDFKVFDNYKCEGQLKMEFNEADVVIKEEKEQRADTVSKRI